MRISDCVSRVIFGIAAVAVAAAVGFAAPRAPREPSELVQSGAKWTVAEALSVSKTFEGSTVVVVLRADDPEITVEAFGYGLGISAGKTLHNRLEDGIYVLLEGGAFRTHGIEWHCKPNTLLLVGDEGIDEEALADGGSVTCGVGYYACCGKDRHGLWRARCIANGHQPGEHDDEPRSCVHGGVGSTACSNGDTTGIWLIDLEE